MGLVSPKNVSFHGFSFGADEQVECLTGTKTGLSPPCVCTFSLHSVMRGSKKLHRSNRKTNAPTQERIKRSGFPRGSPSPPRQAYQPTVLRGQLGKTVVSSLGMWALYSHQYNSSRRKATGLFAQQLFCSVRRASHWQSIKELHHGSQGRTSIRFCGGCAGARCPLHATCAEEFEDMVMWPADPGNSGAADNGGRRHPRLFPDPLPQGTGQSFNTGPV